jgi:hypothetical protein
MLHQIFPIYYHQTSIDKNEEFKTMHMNAIVESYRKNHIGSFPGWITNKMHTSYANDELNLEVFKDGLQDLRQFYSPYIDRFMNKPWAGNMDSPWFNCYIDGDYQEQHSHVSPSLVNPHFSCIHYLSFDEKRHHPVTFVDPSYQLKVPSSLINSPNYDGRYQPSIKEGDFIMFPSYLDHLVKPSPKTEDYPRITISFNLYVTEYDNE